MSVIVRFLKSDTSREIAVGLLFVLTIVAVPWEYLRGTPYTDLQNYVARIEFLRSFDIGVLNPGVSWVELLMTEYLWLCILSLMANLNIEPRVGLLCLSGFSAFVYFKFFSRKVGCSLAFFWLLNPITIDLLLSQVRSAFAFSWFLIALSLVGTRWLYVVFVPIVFLHTSMFAFIVLLLMSQYVASLNKWTVFRRSTLVACGSVVFAILVVWLVPLYLHEGRRDFSSFPIKSPAYLAVWLLWAVVLVVTNRSARCLHWEYYLAITIVVSVPTMELLGFPGFRFLAIAFPIVIGAVALLPQRGARFSACFITVYQVILLAFWLPVFY